jgi:cytochrome c biogenesis protein CcmG, thiol:disulfide interchange protein DsbE
MAGQLMRGMRLWLPLWALVALSAILIYGLSTPRNEYVQSQMIGKKLPDFVLPAALPDGQGFAAADLATGRPILLNIFASWCIPCKAEATQLEALRQQGIAIYGIALRDKPEDLAVFLKETGNPFTRIAGDQQLSVQVALGSTGVPETYLIGGDGTVLHQHIGDIRPDDVAKLLARVKAAK